MMSSRWYRKSCLELSSNNTQVRVRIRTRVGTMRYQDEITLNPLVVFKAKLCTHDRLRIALYLLLERPEN